MKNNNRTWTDKKSLIAQLERLWDKGLILRELVSSSDLFPRSLRFKTPDSKAMSYDFEAVRNWVANIQNLKYFRIVYKTIRHPIIGENRIPAEIWIDDLDTAVLLINKQQAVADFTSLLALTASHTPELLNWIKQYPLKALALANVWPKLLSFVRWRQQHPRPEIYLRQVSLPEIDSKFIEYHRAVISSLLDLVLSEDQIDHNKTGVKQFEQKYGFLSKPERIRFRLLDTTLPLLTTTLSNTDCDISITADDFQQLDQNTVFISQIRRVFITENEINFLSFPAQKNSLVIFGSGYGFDALAKAQWLSLCEIFYWGDIDTHGFAILDQLRNKFPKVNSLLMDEATLMQHCQFWGDENKQEKRELPRLTASEQNLYQALLDNRYAENLRLEQERINYQQLLNILSNL